MKVWDTLRKFLHFVTSVFMYSVLLIMFLILITVVVYAIEEKRNVEQNHYVSPLFSAYVIISNSMVPTIDVLDAVVDHKALPSSIKVGDIITFVSNDSIAYGKTITHRVVGKDQDSNGSYRFRTKGDHNNAEDGWIVPETHVLGKVMFKIPKLGYIQQFLSTSFGWIVTIVFPCLAIIVYDIVKLIGTILRSSKQKEESHGSLD